MYKVKYLNHCPVCSAPEDILKANYWDLSSSVSKQMAYFLENLILDFSPTIMTQLLMSGLNCINCGSLNYEIKNNNLSQNHMHRAIKWSNEII